VAQHGANFQNAVQSRQRAFGGSGQIDDRPNGSMAACFISQLTRQNNYMEFLQPRGLDLSPQVDRGAAVLLTFDSDYSPVKPIHQFSPRRAHRDTLWRIAVEPN
jgi:hypothetical protein